MFKKALVGVAGVHDLHIWSLSTTNTALTAHLVMPGGHPGDGFLAQIANDLSHESQFPTPRCRSRPMIWINAASSRMM